MSVKILELVAQDFKPLRAVEITPKGNMVMITGKNGQGKTSTLEAALFGLIGVKALPNDAVRKGAKGMKVTLKIGGTNGSGPLEFKVIRTLAEGAALPTFKLEMIKGIQNATPQKFLDSIFDARSIDPEEFMRMSSEDQVLKLREMARVETDDKFTEVSFDKRTGEKITREMTSFEAIDAANAQDYKDRGDLNKEAKALAAQIDAMAELAGLPKEKLDEKTVLRQLNNAGEENRKAQEVFKAKQDLARKVADARKEFEEGESQAKQLVRTIGDLELKLKEAKHALQVRGADNKALGKLLVEAENAYQAAPVGEPIDVTALTVELQSIQRTNRAIEQRDAKRALEAQLDAKQKAAQALTRKMEQREEKKLRAISKAKIPIEGIGFNDSMTQVLYNGLPLKSEGEAGQLRISALIAMKNNPQLHDIFIQHGEAIDEDGMKVLVDLAEENDFRIWISKVDSSGKVGIVLEDGMVVAENEEER